MSAWGYAVSKLPIKFWEYDGKIKEGRDAQALILFRLCESVNDIIDYLKEKENTHPQSGG